MVYFAPPSVISYTYAHSCLATKLHLVERVSSQSNRFPTLIHKVPLYDVGPVCGVLSEHLRLLGPFFPPDSTNSRQYVTHNVTQFL